MEYPVCGDGKQYSSLAAAMADGCENIVLLADILDTARSVTLLDFVKIRNAGGTNNGSDWSYD